MPEISRFYGIVIHIYFGDHQPPHFHAHYGGDKAVIAIESLHVLEGSLPKRAMNLIFDWAGLHQRELLEAFERASALQSPGIIPPLD